MAWRERSERFRLGGLFGSLRSRRLRLGLAAVELAHDIGTNRPQVILTGFAFFPLAFAGV